MKKKTEIERRLEQKEFENDIDRALKSQEEKHRFRNLLSRDYHPAGLAAINFFGTLGVCEILFWLIRRLTRMVIMTEPMILADGVYPAIHVFILGLSIAAVILKRSPLDYIFK